MNPPMRNNNLKLDTVCKRCQNVWGSRVAVPLACPRCKSRYWNIEKSVLPPKPKSKYGWDELEIGIEKLFPWPIDGDGRLIESEAQKRARSLDGYFGRRDWRYTWRTDGKGLWVTRTK